MEEARTVIDRLERIEALKRDGAPADELLAEVRQLVVDGDRWLATERSGRRGGPAPGEPTDARALGRAEAALTSVEAKLAAGDRREEVVVAEAGYDR